MAKNNVKKFRSKQHSSVDRVLKEAEKAKLERIILVGFIEEDGEEMIYLDRSTLLSRTDAIGLLEVVKKDLLAGFKIE